MKRYMVFAGVSYYPRPAMGNFVASFATLEELRTKLPDILNGHKPVDLLRYLGMETNSNHGRDWIQVLDTTTDRFMTVDFWDNDFNPEITTEKLKIFERLNEPSENFHDPAVDPEGMKSIHLTVK